jgi:hypothetical protein
MGFKRRFFGDKYLNREGLLKHLYYRIIVRGWFIDFPILIGICYLIPWGELYGNYFMKKIISVIEPIIPNIQDNRNYSDFPEYAVTYLSIVHLLGLVCLLFPILYSKSIPEVGLFLNKHGHHPVKVILLGVVGTFCIFLIPHLYVGAVTYFGCYECSYHNKLSLIAGAVVPWALINLFFLYTLMVIKYYFKK